MSSGYFKCKKHNLVSNTGYCPKCEAKEKYKGDAEHLLEYEDGHDRFDCWCEPELVHVDGEHYLLHKDKDGNTILNDHKFNKNKKKWEIN